MKFYNIFIYIFVLAVGASNNSCTEVFAGPHGGSELETIAITNHVLRLQRIGKLIYYFAFHSYSQMTLVPYSHVYNEGVLEVPNYGDLVSFFIKYILFIFTLFPRSDKTTLRILQLFRSLISETTKCLIVYLVHEG